VSAEILLMVAFEINAGHGQPPTDEERYHQAIQLVETGECTQEMAAAVTGLTRGQVATAVTRHQARRRARRLKIPRWERLPIGTLQRAHSVSTDAGFAALVQLAVEAQLGSGDVSRLVTTMNRERTEQGQVGIVHAEEQHLRPRIAQTAGGMLKPRADNPHVALYRHLGGVAKLNLDRLDEAVKSKEDRALAAKKCDEAAERLMAMAERLRAP
jgi:hypothetical protein